LRRAAGAGLRGSATEQGPDARQKAAGAGLLLGLALALIILNLGFELLKALVGRAQGLILHDHGLGQEIGRIGLLADIVQNKRFGLAVALGAGGPTNTIEQALQKLALFG
jgi:hypothetical protein